MNSELVNFDDIPLGGKFRYPSDKKVWVIVSKYRNCVDNEPMSGTIIEYTGELGITQSICFHFGEDEGCPQMVEFIPFIDIGQKAIEFGEVDWLISAIKERLPNSQLNGWVESKA